MSAKQECPFELCSSFPPLPPQHAQRVPRQQILRDGPRGGSAGCRALEPGAGSELGEPVRRAVWPLQPAQPAYTAAPGQSPPPSSLAVVMSSGVRLALRTRRLASARAARPSRPPESAPGPQARPGEATAAPGMRGRGGGGGPKSWACRAAAKDGQRRGPMRPRPGRGRGTEATAGPRRPGPVQEGRRAGDARSLGQQAAWRRWTRPSRSLPPHLQDPDPSGPARRRRFRWLRGLQRARGPGLHLPHGRPKLQRRPAGATAREPRRRARAAGGLTPPPRPRP